MSMPAFDGVALKVQLEKLDSNRQLAFGAACCERLLPNYLAFQKDSGWGDIVPIREALNCIWKFLGGELIDSNEIKNITNLCEAVIPNSEDFTSLYVTSAQDACFAVCSLLDFLLKSDVNKIVQVATYATDSVDLYVQEIENMASNDPRLEKKILEHQLMQRELKQQQKDLETVRRAPSLDQGFLSQYKSQWNNEGKSNLDLP